MSKKYIHTHTRDEYPEWWDGRAIECKVWDEKVMAGQVEIIGIDVDSLSPFLDSLGGFWLHAEPILKKQKVKRYLDPVSMMQWLVDHGYKYLSSFEGWGADGITFFENRMWYYCGKLVDTRGADAYYWRDEWIEEVEE